MPELNLNTCNYNIQSINKASRKVVKPASNALKFSSCNDSFEYSISNPPLLTKRLKSEFEEIQSHQGPLEKAWDGFKRITKIGASSTKTQNAIKDFENGKISLKEAQEKIEKYKQGQKMSVDVAADMISGVVSMGAFALAVPTGGASLAVGLSLAALSGTCTKVGIKALDSQIGNNEYSKKDLIHDTLTGAVNGVLAPVTNGIGASVTKTIGKKLGLVVVTDGIKETVQQGAKATLAQSAKSILTTRSVDVLEGTLAKRALALGAGMAVDGAISGASDNALRAGLEGENVIKAGAQGAIGGLIMAPVIGGGFRVAGKLGHSLNNKITTKAVLKDGAKTTFKQGSTGDCALLSTLDGIANNEKTKNLIEKSIVKPLGEGSYQVKIGENFVTVPKSTITDEMLSDTKGIKIFEAAYKQLHGSIDGGFAEVVAKDFGLNPLHIDSISDEVLDAVQKEQDNLILSLGAKVNSNGEISAQGSNHYFTIKNIDSANKKVTLTNPYNTAKNIEISYDDIKKLGISIDGASIGETKLFSIERNALDDEFFGSKNKTKFKGVVDSKDIDRTQELKDFYIGKSKYDLDLMEESLELVDDEVAQKIRATGDLYTDEQIVDIQDFYEQYSNYTLDEIVKTRASSAKLNAAVSNCNQTELKHEFKEYIERYVEFTSQNPDKLAISTEKLNTFIEQMKTELPYDETLYRGVLSDSEIARLFYLLDKKIANPSEVVVYAPGQLTSTSKVKDSASQFYGKKCLLNIQTPKGSTGKKQVKALNVNEVYDKLKLGDNPFKCQNELLFPSDVKFEIKNMQIIDDVPNFFLEILD